MSKLWTQAGKLIMQDGVLCYQDVCPCTFCDSPYPGYLSTKYTFIHPPIDPNSGVCCEDATNACPDMAGEYTLDYMGKIEYSTSTLYWWQSATFELEDCDWGGLGSFIWQLRIEKSVAGVCSIILAFGRAVHLENYPENSYHLGSSCGPGHNYGGRFKEDCLTIEIAGPLMSGYLTTCRWEDALPFDLEPA